MWVITPGSRHAQRWYLSSSWAVEATLVVTEEKSERLRQVRWTLNRQDQLHGRSTHFSMDREPRWRWCQLFWALKLGEMNPGQMASHPGCQQKWNKSLSAWLNFSFGSKAWQEASLMTSLLCKTCRLGCSDYNGCSYLNSSTAASGRPLSQVLKGRYKYWPELPRKGKVALEPPSRFCHRHFCHSPATFPMPFTSLSLANFKTLLFIYVLSSKLSQTATYCFSLCFPLKFHSSLKR